MNNEFTQHELIRYGKQMMLPEIGVSGQRKLKEKNVLVVGAGGLGAPVLQYLAGAGIGCLGIVDDDTVSLSNLHRQLLYTENDIGITKVSSAILALKKINSDIEYKGYEARLTPNNTEKLINEYDLIIDGTDNYSSRYIINDTCFKLKKPFIYASVSRFKAQCSFFSGKEGACYRCIFENITDHDPACANGTLGPVVGLIAMVQANEAIKYCLDQTPSLLNKVLTLDAQTLQFDTIALMKNPSCPIHKTKNTVVSTI